MTEAPKKKGGALKWVVGGCLVIVVLGIVGIGAIIYMVSQAVITEPAKVEELAGEILPMEIPAGMKGQMGMSMMGVEMAMFAGSDAIGSDKALMLMRFPPSVGSPEEMKRQMRQQMAQHGQDRNQGRQVEQKVETFTLRGQEIEGQVNVFQKDEGENAARSVQVMIVAADADGKPVLVMFMGPEAEVTKEYIQSSLDTVK